MQGRIGLRKTRSGKSHDCLDVIVLEKLRFQNGLGPHENGKEAFSNSSSLKSVFEKLCFCDGLVWTVGLTVEFKLRFQIPLVVWTLSQYDIVLMRMTKRGQNHLLSITHNKHQKRKNGIRLRYSRTGWHCSVDLLEFF